MQAADPRTTHAWTRTASWARDDQNLAELVPLLERLEDLSPDQALRDRLQELTGSSPGRYLAFTAIQAVMDGGGRLPEAWLTAQRLAEYEAWRAAERLDRRAVEITRDWALGCEDRFVGGVDVTTGLGTSLTQGVLRILRREEADAGD